MRDKKRRSILEGQAPRPELRQRADACRAIDQLLARATSLEPDRRPQEGQELAASLYPWLAEGSPTPRAGKRLMNSLLNLAPPGDLSSWVWTVRHPPGDERVMLSSAWDVDGKCLALTSDGPAFWNGQSWVAAREVARESAGRHALRAALRGGRLARRRGRDARGVLDGRRARGAPGARGEHHVFARERPLRRPLRRSRTEAGRGADALRHGGASLGEAGAARRRVVRRDAAPARRRALARLRAARAGDGVCGRLHAARMESSPPSHAADARLRGRRDRAGARPRARRRKPRSRACAWTG